MPYDYNEEKKKQVTSMRSYGDYGRGILFILVGLFIFFHAKLNIDFARFSSSPVFDKVFGGLWILYGTWRIYRGYKKNYFK